MATAGGTSHGIFPDTDPPESHDMTMLAGELTMLTLCFASSLLCLCNFRFFPSKSICPTRKEGAHKKRAPNSLNLKVQVFLKRPHTSDHRTRAPHGCSPVTAAGGACVYSSLGEGSAAGFPAFPRLSPLSSIIVEHVFASFP